MPAATKLFINQSAEDPAEALVESVASAAAGKLPVFFRGSQPVVELHFLRSNPDQSYSSGAAPFVYDDPAAFDSVQMALGVIDDPPNELTFTLTDTQAPQTSTAIAYNASAATLQAAIRASLSTNYAFATVTGASPSWEINRGTTGVIDDLEGNGDLLFPVGSNVLVTPTQAGDATHSARWQVTLLEAHAVARSTGWDPLPAAAVAIEVQVIGTSDRNKTFRVTWNADAYSGGVFLNFTGVVLSETVGPIRYNATEEEIETLFQDHTEAEDDWIIVLKNGPGDYSITCVGNSIRRTDAPSLGEDSNTLAVPVGLTATFNCNAVGVDYLLGDEEEISDATLEIKKNVSGLPVLVLQRKDATVRKDLIRSATATSSSPIALANFSNHPAITGLTGGGSTKLDGIVTAGTLSAGHVVFVNVAGSPTIWRLTVGTDPEDAPAGIVRPDDYAASTNEKVWLSVL